MQSPKLIYGISRLQILWENPYLCFQNHSSVHIISLPVSIDSDTLDYLSHIYKEDLSTLLPTYMISGGIRSKSCTLCLVLKTKVCQDTSSWAETRRCNKSITHLRHGAQTKMGPNSVTHLVLHPCKWDSPAQSSIVSQNRNRIVLKVIAKDLQQL